MSEGEDSRFSSHLASRFFKCLGWNVPATALLPRKVVWNRIPSLSLNAMIWKRSVQASTTVTTEFLVQKARGAAWRLSQDTGMRRKSNQPQWDEETVAISPPISTPSRPRWRLRCSRRRHTFLRRLLCPVVPSTPTWLATCRVVVGFNVHETPKKRHRYVPSEIPTEERVLWHWHRRTGHGRFQVHLPIWKTKEPKHVHQPSSYFKKALEKASY